MEYDLLLLRSSEGNACLKRAMVRVAVAFLIPFLLFWVLPFLSGYVLFSASRIESTALDDLRDAAIVAFAFGCILTIVYAMACHHGILVLSYRDDRDGVEDADDEEEG